MIFFIGGIVEDADAQRRKRKKREQKTEETEDRGNESGQSLSDKLTYEIGIGNSNSFSGFNIGLRPAVGYKAAKFLNVGVGARYLFEYINLPNEPDVTLNSFGIFPYVQIKINQSLYLKGIYEYGNYKNAFRRCATCEVEEDSITEITPLFGAGYTSGPGDWKWGFEILFVGNEVVRDLDNNPLQFWIVSSYRL